MAAQPWSLEGAPINPGDNPRPQGSVLENCGCGDIEFCGEQMFALQIGKFDIYHDY
jgi:hypothetical protein